MWQKEARCPIVTMAPMKKAVYPSHQGSPSSSSSPLKYFILISLQTFCGQLYTPVQQVAIFLYFMGVGEKYTMKISSARAIFFTNELDELARWVLSSFHKFLWIWHKNGENAENGGLMIMDRVVWYRCCCQIDISKEKKVLAITQGLRWGWRGGWKPGGVCQDSCKPDLQR